MLDYTDHVSFCRKLEQTLKEQKQWPEICHIQREKSTNPEMFHRLASFLYNVLVFVCLTDRKCKEPETPVPVADTGTPHFSAPETAMFYQLPSSSSKAERLPPLQRV